MEIHQHCWLEVLGLLCVEGRAVGVGVQYPLRSTVSAGLQGPAVGWRNQLAAELAGRGREQLQLLPGKRWEETKLVLEAPPSPSVSPAATPLLPADTSCPLLSSPAPTARYAHNWTWSWATTGTPLFCDHGKSRTC